MKRSALSPGTKPLKPMSDKKLAELLAAGERPTSTFRRKLRQISLPGSGVSVGRSAGGGAVGVPLSVPRPRAVSHRLPVDVRDTVRARSAGGWCELQLPGCTGQANQLHHRITQKAGGRHGAAARRSDRPSNLLFVDASCHDLVTDHPGRAYAYGWALREGQEPTRETVLYRGELSYLDDVGGVHSFEKAGA